MPSEALTYIYQEIHLTDANHHDSSKPIPNEIAYNPLPELSLYLKQFSEQSNEFNTAALVGKIAHRAVTLFGEESVGVAFGGHVIAQANVDDVQSAFVKLPYKTADGRIHLVCIIQ